MEIIKFFEINFIFFIVLGSVSMCDPVIDEHFRRSLGADYMNLFNKTKEANGLANGKTPNKNVTDRASSPISFNSDPEPSSPINIPNNDRKSPNGTESNTSTSSVEEDAEENDMDVDETDAGLSVDDHFAKALGDTWKKLQEKSPISADKLKLNKK